MQCILQYKELDVTSKYTYFVLFCMSSIIATFANTVVLVVLWLPRQRTKSNKIFTSLAVSDLFVGVISCPLHAAQIILVKDHATNHTQLCQIESTRRFMAVLAIGSSIITVAVIAYDRYILLTKLKNYNIVMTNRKLNVFIVTAWLIPILTLLVKIIDEKAYWLLMLIVLLGVIIVLLFCYIKIIGVIRQSRVRVIDYQGQQSNNDMRLYERHLRIAKKVTLLVTVYVACFLPSFVWFTLQVVTMYSAETIVHAKASVQLYTFASFAGMFNSCVNPFIYAWNDYKFKGDLKRIFGRSELMEEDEL